MSNGRFTEARRPPADAIPRWGAGAPPYLTGARARAACLREFHRITSDVAVHWGRIAEGLPPGGVLAIGRAPSDVSSVNVQFSDGTVVNAATYAAGSDQSDRYWLAMTSLAGDSHEISVASVTAAGNDGP